MNFYHAFKPAHPYCRQLIRVMKLTVLLITLFILQVSAKSLAQQITLNEKQVSLEKLFKEIRKQSRYDFFYDAALIQKAGPVSINVTNATLDETLKIIIKDPLTFTISDRTVIIKEKSPPMPEKQPATVLPPKDVTGHVTDKQGVPLVNATVLIKRTKTGVLTDVKGNFTIRDVLPDDILIISYIGYKPALVKVGDQTVLNIVMEVTSNDLDQVIVQAYGKTSQRLNTGDIATLTAKQIERQPVMNVLQALQGQVPGVVVQQTSGYASAPIKVEIRGRNSVGNLPSDPLYIIDGVPLTTLNLASPPNSNVGNANYNSGSRGFIQNGLAGPANGQSPFFSINPSDIESLTVLKDADATAIYGSRGSNGVIIITTKKGSVGKTKFDLNVYSGYDKATGRYDLLNPSQYYTMRREAFRNDGITPDAGNAYDLVIWNLSNVTDWQDKVLGRVGRTNDAEASLSGGNNLTTFRLSGDYHKETSILNYSGADQRASVQFNLTQKSLNQRLNISFTSMYSYTQSDLIVYSQNSLLPPDAPGDIFNEQGQLNYAAWKPIDGSFPFGNLLQPYTAKTDFLNSQLAIKYELLKGLTISTNFGYSISHVSQIVITPIASLDPFQNPTGNSEFGNNNSNNVIVEPQLEFKKIIAKGQFTAMVGGSAQSVSQDGNSINGYGYINDALLGSVTNAPIKNAFNSDAHYKYAAIFSRINYNWEDKYIVNLSARRDGSSRFGPANRFGNFGAVGGAWIFTEEDWIKKNIPLLSFGKIRASYGITGSDNIGDYQYLTQWSNQGLVPYQKNTPSYIPAGLANPDFHWEVNKKLELGLNLGFFKDWVNIEASWYRNHCDNQLITFPLPLITGFGGVTANSPANVQNTGWEVTLKTKIIDSKDISLSLTVNGGRNYNKLLAYPNLQKSPYYGRYVIGQPLNIIGVLHYTGVDPLTGQYTFQDRNHDGIINADYAVRGGDYYYRENNVLLDGGSTIDFRYKSLQLNVFFTFRENPFEQSAIFSGVPGTIGNQSVQVLNRWQKPGDVAQFASYTTQFRLSDAHFQQASDGVYSDGSYVRLRNLSISYDLPDKLAKSVGMRGCKIYLRGENLFIITKYNGLDPDTPFGALPPAKILTGGIQFNF